MTGLANTPPWSSQWEVSLSSPAALDIKSQTHEVKSFFHLMNSNRSSLLESKYMKERGEQECDGRRERIKIYSHSVPGGPK